MRFWRVLVGLLTNLQLSKQRQEDGAADESDDEPKDDPKRRNPGKRARVERRKRKKDVRVHETPASIGLVPAPRHLITTTGVCSSPLPCGLSSSARSTAAASTPALDPRTLAF